MAERLAYLVAQLGSQSAFARRVGISQSRVSQLLAGEELGLEVAVRVARATGCSLDWLVLDRRPDDYAAGVAAGQQQVRDELAPYLRAIAAVTQLDPARPAAAPAPLAPPETADAPRPPGPAKGARRR